MKTILKFILFSFSLIGFLSVNAQYSPKIKKKDYKIQVSQEDLKELSKELRKGNMNYNQMKPGTYLEASKHFLNAYKFIQDNAALDYKLGISLLYSSPKKEALDYLISAYENNQYITKDLNYYLARAYHFNWNFDKADYHYDEYFNSLKKSQQKKQIHKIEHLKKQCANGKILVKKDTNVIITNLGPLINSEYDDYNPIFSADESEMYFTSRRPTDEKSRRNETDNRFYEDVYVTFVNNEEKWSDAYRVDEPINSEYNDAAISISMDGQELYLYKGNKDFGALYKTSLKGDKWKTPAQLSSRFNSEYHETSLAYSFDGKIMFFVSDNPNKSIGGKDIYSSSFNGKKWSKPENLGPVINTQFDEECVYLAPDNKTLYFSSKGHNSMGGYDVFKSDLQGNGIWSPPVNIGVPVNTPYDDMFFKPTLNGRFAYYSSINDSVNHGGSDLYEIFFFIPKPLIQSNEDNLIASQANPVQEAMIEKTLEIKTIRLTIVEGIVSSSTGENVEAKIEVTSLNTNTIVSELSSNSKTGKYIVTLLPGNNYSMNVKASGYLFHSENFNIPATAQYQKIKKDIELQKVAIGAKVVLKNVFFDTGKATLSPKSFDELEKLISFMNENPTVKIEIGGHSDNIGNYNSNLKLSKQRAQAVVEHLLQKAISPDRLESKGYSSSESIADNKTEEGRQKNRRVEARITGY